MSDKTGELCTLLAKIKMRKAETIEAGQKIDLAINRAHGGTQANIEILRRKAQGGDKAAEKAYLALLRNRNRIA
jgi:hypothetical protein